MDRKWTSFGTTGGILAGVKDNGASAGGMSSGHSAVAAQFV